MYILFSIIQYSNYFDFVKFVRFFLKSAVTGRSLPQVFLRILNTNCAATNNFSLILYLQCMHMTATYAILYPQYKARLNILAKSMKACKREIKTVMNSNNMVSINGKPQVRVTYILFN